MAKNPIDPGGGPTQDAASANVNFTDGSATGGNLNHTRILALLEAARAKFQTGVDVTDGGYEGIPLIANGVDVAVGAQAKRRYTVEECIAIGVVSGPLTGTKVEGCILRIFTIGTNNVKDTPLAAYFMAYSTMSNFNLAAFPVVTIYP